MATVAQPLYKNKVNRRHLLCCFLEEKMHKQRTNKKITINKKELNKEMKMITQPRQDKSSNSRNLQIQIFCPPETKSPVLNEFLSLSQCSSNCSAHH